MKTDKYLFAAAALTVLTACSSDYDFSENGDMERIPVTLAYKTLTTTETRAAQNLNEGTFDSGEQGSEFISQTDQNSWTEYAYQTIADGAMIPSGTIPYYSNDYNYDIAAFYPQLSGETFSIQTDQTTDAAYKQSDLMYASVINQARQHAPVTLDFKHKMAKICVNATPGEGVGAITGVKLLNVKPEVTYDKAGNVALNTTADNIDVTMSNFGAAVIPAQSVSGNFLAVTTAGGTATYRFDANAFEAGMVYTMNVTVEQSAIGQATDVPVTVTNATASHLGWLVTNKGYIYQTAAAIPAGQTPVAMICYMGEPGTADHSSNDYRGLAIALKDAANGVKWCAKEEYERCYELSSDNMRGIAETMVILNHTWNEGHTSPAAEAAVANSGTASPVGTTGWFLPSSGQWDLIMSTLMQGAAYEAATINAWFTTAGLDASTYDALSGSYWSSTQSPKTNFQYYRVIQVYRTDTGICTDYIGGSNDNYKYSTHSVRSIVAF